MKTRIAAWLLAATVAILSLVPPDLRPITKVPHALEHFAIFAATGLAFGLAYGGRYSVTATLLIFTGAIEVAQTFVPGRHARLSDFIVDALAGCIGLLAAYYIPRRKREARSSTDFPNHQAGE